MNNLLTWQNGLLLYGAVSAVVALLEHIAPAGSKFKAALDRIQGGLIDVKKLLGLKEGAAPPPVGHVSLMLLAVVALASGSIACAALKTLPKQAVVCEKQAITDVLPSLVPQVIASLSAGPVAWSAGLDALVESQGEAAVCAIQAVVADLETKVSAPAETTTVSTVQALSAEVLLIRVQAYMHSNHFRPSMPSVVPVHPDTVTMDRSTL